MKHIDLFSGIGGFAYAIDKIFHEEKHEHIFVDNDTFCQEVLRKHWPEAEIHGDIRKFIADSGRANGNAGKDEKKGKYRRKSAQPVSVGCDKSSAPDSEGKLELELAMERKPDEEVNSSVRADFLTGGFPCQPFSQAGRRKGTDDDRYLWPAMLECITLFRPRWIIAENVGGLATWNEGLVLEQVCTDLEKEGYEVRPFIIPACAVNAPHRRDRIWIIANSEHGPERDQKRRGDEARASVGTPRSDTAHADSAGEGLEGECRCEPAQPECPRCSARRSWNKDWFEVASELCRVDDGIPDRLDGDEGISGEPEKKTKKTSAGRAHRLKALGNSIVPEVAMEILNEIKNVL